MKITIDTKEDSHEDLRKVIAMLSKLIEGSEHHSNIFEDSGSSLDLPGTDSSSSSESSGTNAFANMFGDSSGEETPVLPVSESSDEDDSDEEQEEDAPEIMEY